MMTDAMRVGYADTLAEVGADIAATIRFTSDRIYIDGIWNILYRLHGEIDRKLLGCRFNKKSKEIRSRYWAVIEKMDISPHLHVGWKAPPSMEIDDFKMAFAKINLEKLGIEKDCKINPKLNSGWELYSVKSLTTADHIKIV